MSLIPGTVLGPYEISGRLGAGGMGEVYRARDTRLNRDVAIKVLPELFAADRDRAARFEREAQLLASLNHPHIAQVHGIIDTPTALVMELVAGEDLAARVARGPIPVAESLRLATQIADALAAAHDRGIVHRDLKPANIMVTDDGVVKVLDFGLAKALEPPPSTSAGLMNSPTITSPAAMTRMGVILGTAAYMSPEQAKAKTVDRSADLWAFGAVLYEMLTGRPAFDGETVTDVLAAIVTRDPDWTALPANTPGEIRRLLRRCLDRDRRRRLADAGEARFLIEEAISAPVVSVASASASTQGRRPDRLRSLPWILAGVLVLALGGASWLRESGSGQAIVRVSIETPLRAQLATALRPSLSISGDGRSVAFVATSGGTDRIYVRTADHFEARPLEGTEGASSPEISPDGAWIAFVSGNKLFKTPIGGGPRIEIGDVADPRGISWNTDGSILVTPQFIGGIVRIPSDGGPPETVTTPIAGKERTHRWAQMLPGGKAVIFTVGDFNNPDSYLGARIDAQVLATGERKVLVTGAEMARYSPSGHLVFARAGVLFAVPFDPDRLIAGQAPKAVLHGVAGDTTTGAAHFDISAAGTLAYVAASGGEPLTQPAWVDKAAEIEFLAVPPGAYADPAISPDGKRVAMSVIAGGGRDLWVYDVDRKTFTRMTFSGANYTPLWSADGTWIYYAALDSRDAAATIWRRPADGSGEAEALVTLPHGLFLNHIAADGGTAIFDYSSVHSNASDIASIVLEKNAKAKPFINGATNEFAARVSPDGRWIAYESTESSRSEIYVRPADPVASRRWQVSTAGGREPKWARDGRTLYYRFANQLRAVAIESTHTFKAGMPVQLLPTIYDSRVESGVTYDVDARDRFMTIRLVDEGAFSNTVRLIVNWLNELKKITDAR